MSTLRTHQSRVPWSWVVWMTTPWVSFFYTENVSNGALTFTLRKFIENPAYIAFLSSLNLAFNLLVGVAASYMSDRIWTRWGRRRPFLIVGWSGVALTMIWVPLATNAWSLVLLIILYQFFADIAKPLEPLHNEVVPPAQRGRAATVRSIAQNIMNMFFFGVMLAQFDRSYNLAGWGAGITITGESVVYWTGSALLLAGVLFLAFRLRETPPPEEIRRERFALGPFLHETFGQRQWWLVYLLYAVPLLATPGLYVFEPLLVTEQLGLSKADYGHAVTVSLIVNIVLVIPLAGYLTDHVPRLLFMQYVVAANALVAMSYFLFLRYVAHHSVSLPVLIGSAIIIQSFRTALNLVWGPLVYDFIPSERFGTVSAGLAFVSGLVPFLLVNLAGGWVTGFTALLGPRGAARFDYSSVYAFQFAMGFAALAVLGYLRREVRAGRLVQYGLKTALPDPN